MSCLCLVYVFSMSFLSLVYFLSMSCLYIIYVLSMCYLCIYYVRSTYCLCVVHELSVLSMSSLCLVYVLSMSCLCPSFGLRGGGHAISYDHTYIMFCEATSKNLPNLVIYEIWRKSLTVSDRRKGGRTNGQTKWVIEEQCCQKRVSDRKPLWSGCRRRVGRPEECRSDYLPPPPPATFQNFQKTISHF